MVPEFVTEGDEEDEEGMARFRCERDRTDRGFREWTIRSNVGEFGDEFGGVMLMSRLEERGEESKWQEFE